MTTTTAGWPFLIARGRRRGYAVLLAPTWLIDERDHGLLEEVVSPLNGATPHQIGTATTVRGRRLDVIWAEHTLTAADLASEPGALSPRDEHSRPLNLLYGYLCVDSAICQPTSEDLAHSRRAALNTYRRFLIDEDGFTIEGSTPFDRAAAPALPPPALTRRSTPRPALRRPALPVLLGLLAATLTAAGAIWLDTASDEAPAPSRSPSVSATPSPTSANTTVEGNPPT